MKLKLLLFAPFVVFCMLRSADPQGEIEKLDTLINNIPTCNCINNTFSFKTTPARFSIALVKKRGVRDIMLLAAKYDGPQTATPLVGSRATSQEEGETYTTQFFNKDVYSEVAYKNLFYGTKPKKCECDNVECANVVFEEDSKVINVYFPLLIQLYNNCPNKVDEDSFTTSADSYLKEKIGDKSVSTRLENLYVSCRDDSISFKTDTINLIEEEIKDQQKQSKTPDNVIKSVIIEYLLTQLSNEICCDPLIKR